MKQTAASKTTKTIPADNFTIGSVGLQLLDTTWRIAVPVLIFALLGIFADLRLGTKPWMTILGVAIGFVFAAKLVNKQIKAVEKQEKNQ
ncbi:MAG TPA: AtpZ/AtpI family protein [Patescibacteria group bacterium]|jgi:hypothetical protein|nr:AtpZ/AtpI family protein [Patescibacteria group bacterium]